MPRRCTYSRESARGRGALGIWEWDGGGAVRPGAIYAQLAGAEARMRKRLLGARLHLHLHWPAGLFIDALCCYSG